MSLALPLLLAVLMTGWVAVDADGRGRNWMAWALLVAMTGGLGLLVWLLVRRRSPAVEVTRGGARRIGVFLAAVPLVLLVGIVTIFTVTFLFQVARVEGQAMAPTLMSGDRLIVNKLAYTMRGPRFDDIVMMYYPLNPDKVFVKRIIGEEGDSIRIEDGRVYRNDVPINDGYVLAEYRSHDDYGPEVVPQGYYFVMGDHRNNSSDSRHWKFVPKKYIIGLVQLRWWPWSTRRAF